MHESTIGAGNPKATGWNGTMKKIGGGLRETRCWTIPDCTILVERNAAGVVSVTERNTFQSRAAATMSVLSEALPDRAISLLVSLDDRPRRIPWRRHALYGAAGCPGYSDIAAPDFVVGGWPEAGIFDYDETCLALAAAGASPPLTDLLGWYGNAGTIPIRKEFVRRGREHPELCELVDTSDWHRDGKRMDQTQGTASGGTMTMAQQAARFAFLIDIEGQGYSGRLKMLLHSGRPVLVQERPWKDWFWPKLIPWVHYAPVARDLSDLFAVLAVLRADRPRAAAIGAEGRKFAKTHLTRAAAITYWRQLLSA